MADHTSSEVHLYYLADESELALDLIHAAIDEQLTELSAQMYYYQGRIASEAHKHIQTPES